MRTFEGRTVAVLESRKASELVAMIERLGGSAVAAPAVCERPTLEGAASLIGRIVAGGFDVAIALTGAGVSALLTEAARLGSAGALVDALRVMTVVCRGPKPLGVFRRHGIAPAIISAPPHTTAELLERVRAIDISGKKVLLLHYGERNQPLTEALRDEGALVQDACLYEWTRPDDVRPMQALVTQLIAGRIDAVLFTSQIQFRFLQSVAREMGAYEGLVESLNRDVVVGAVGPVCAAALRAGGVAPDVLPAAANSASLVGAVADYLAAIQSEE